MRILHINIARGFRGGERQTQLLIEALSHLGVQQGLLARHDSPLFGKLGSLDRLHRIPVRKPYISALGPAGRFNPDIVHAHDGKAAQWAYLNYRLHRTPYVITRRVPNPLSNVAFTRAVYRNAARVVGLSRAIADGVTRLVPGRRVEVIPSMYASLPVDPERLARLQARYRDCFVVGHIGALDDRHKGQSVLIEAAAILSRKYSRLRFVLLGEGDDELYFKRLAADCSCIEFAGFVDDVGTWINVFDMLAFPSRKEGLGSILLDVMQHGRPIVASDVDGIPEIVDNGRSGILVPPGDPEKLAGAIERLYLDKDFRHSMAAAGQSDIDRFSPVRIAQCYHTLYDAVLKAG